MKAKNVKIPKKIYSWIENRLPETEFGSVDEYVTYVLKQVKKDIGGEKEDSYSEEDEKIVKERLRALGYLD